MRPILLKWGGLGALSVVALTIGLLLTLPTHIVSRIVEAQAEKALGFRYDIHVERTRVALPVGVKLIGVRISESSARAAADGPPPLELDSVRASVSPLSVFGALSGRVDVRSGEGRVRVSVRPGDDGGRALRLEFFEFELGTLAPLSARLGMPIAGAVSGTVDLAYDAENRLVGGNVEGGVGGLTIGPGALRSQAFRQFGGSVPLPASDFGNLIIRAPIEGPDIQITEFRAEGSDLRVNLSGDVQLRNPMSASRVDLLIDFGLDGAYVEEAGLGAALALPEVQRLQSGEGFSLAVSGPLSRPSVSPATRNRGGR